MQKSPILEGERFGRLVAKRIVRRELFNVDIWECVCDCGEKIEVKGRELRHKRVKSCGCWRNSKNKEFIKTPEYKIWIGIKNRCYNENEPSFKYYGGRGIKVCNRWKYSFENFLEDMGPRPHSKGKRSYYTIERRDNNGDYCPENCYWASLEDQNSNKRNNRYFEYNGEKFHLSEWARKFGKKSHSSIGNWLAQGKSFEEICLYYETKQRRKIV